MEHSSFEGCIHIRSEHIETLEIELINLVIRKHSELLHSALTSLCELSEKCSPLGLSKSLEFVHLSQFRSKFSVILRTKEQDEVCYFSGFSVKIPKNAVILHPRIEPIIERKLPRLKSADSIYVVSALREPSPFLCSSYDLSYPFGLNHLRNPSLLTFHQAHASIFAALEHLQF